MYLIASFGILMMLLCTIMVVSPDYFARGVILFSEKSYFHLFEIFSRIIAGIIFIIYSSDTLFPGVFTIIGWALVVVGLGLSLTPPRLHRKFAVWSANRFRKLFRLIGIISIPLSLLFIYAAIGQQGE